MALEHGPPPSPIAAASCVCSGSSTSLTKASVNAPSYQQHHTSFDNAACGGSDISNVCHLPVRRVFDFNTNIHGWKRPRGRPKTRWADSNKHYLHYAGLNTSNAAQIVYDRPQRKAFVCGCQRYNPLLDAVALRQRTGCVLIELSASPM